MQLIKQNWMLLLCWLCVKLLKREWTVPGTKLLLGGWKEQVHWKGTKTLLSWNVRLESCMTYSDFSSSGLLLECAECPGLFLVFSSRKSCSRISFLIYGLHTSSSLHFPWGNPGRGAKWAQTAPSQAQWAVNWRKINLPSPKQWGASCGIYKAQPCAR